MSDYNLMWNEAELITEASSTSSFTEAPALQPPARISETTMDRAAASPAENVQSSATEWRPGLERRKRRRAQVKMPAGVRSLSIGDSFREVVTTENASRAGLCFRTNAGHYHAGMKLRVTFPYSSHSDGASSSENPGNIVRLEAIAGGGFRVAVSFDPPTFTAPSNSSGKTARPANERRRHKRSEISAVAVLREEPSEGVMKARCSELSLGGCYIDTINPVPIGTTVKLEIQKDERVLTTYATVCSSHRGSGMGLSFHNLTPDLTSLLFNWLL